MSANDQYNGKEDGAAPPSAELQRAAAEGGDAVLLTTEQRPSVPPLVAGLDLEEEAARDVAPIGPTEPSQIVDPTDWDGPSSGPKSARSTGDLERQIRELEARLDRMITEGLGERRTGEQAPAAGGSTRGLTAHEGGDAARGPSGREGGDAARSPAGREGGDREQGRGAGRAEDEAHATARELLSSDFYLRQWGRAAMRSRSEDVDEFGFDPQYEARYKPLFDFLYRWYFRVEVQGIEQLPEEGRCLVVCNHSGGPLPYDGIMLRTALRREHPAHRELRWLAEDFVYHLPFAGTAMNRPGAVRACQENAERLLAGGRLVGVFPEGVKGIGKLYKERYRLQRFGRGGFIRLCLRTRTPLVTCAIVGAEETNPLLYRFEHLTRALGIPYVPITPTFPVLGPLGLVPAPTKWKMRFGEVVRFDEYGAEAAEDDILVGRLAERVRASIQEIIDQILAERKSIWFG